MRKVWLKIGYMQFLIHEYVCTLIQIAGANFKAVIRNYSEKKKFFEGSHNGNLFKFILLHMKLYMSFIKFSLHPASLLSVFDLFLLL